MTTHEFNNTSFHKGMKVSYYNEAWLIAQVDFEEMLIGLIKETELREWQKGIIKATWCRCENCSIIHEEAVK